MSFFRQSVHGFKLSLFYLSNFSPLVTLILLMSLVDFIGNGELPSIDSDCLDPHAYHVQSRESREPYRPNSLFSIYTSQTFIHRLFIIPPTVEGNTFSKSNLLMFRNGIISGCTPL